MKFLLNWLLNHFLFAGTMFFAAAAVADPAGGADAGAEDSAGGDGTAAGADGADGSGEADAGTGEGTGAVDEPGAASGDRSDIDPNAAGAKLDQRAMPVAVKEAIKNLQGLNPTAAAWLKDELGANRAFRTEFPGGLKEARDLKVAAETFKTDFPEGIEGIKAEKADWAGIDEAWGNAVIGQAC